MKINRMALRNEAKKMYKEQVKDIPKSQRLPFKEFFKRYRNMKLQENKKANLPEVNLSDDFDFEDMINTNKIDDNEDNSHVGSTFDSFLKEQEALEEDKENILENKE